VRRVLTAVALLGLVFGLVVGIVRPHPADAQKADAGRNDDSINAGAGSPGATGSTAGSPATRSVTRTGGGSGRATCTYTAVPWELGVVMVMIDSVGLDEPQVATPEAEGSNVAGDGSRTFYRKCEGRPGQYVLLPPRRTGASPAEPPTPGELAEEAVQQTPLPRPIAGMSPAPPIPQLVNLPVFLWIDPVQWVPQTASASAGGVTSTVTAVPLRVVWDMGDGESVTCDGPGVPYVPGVADELQPSDCQHTYRRSSARAADETFTVTTTMEWDVTWVAVGAPGGGSLGTARRSSTSAVQVSEIQTLNVPAR